MKFQMASYSPFWGSGGGRGKSRGLHVVTLHFTKHDFFLTSPRYITMQYRPLSDASVTISSIRLHMHNLQTKLRTALFWLDERSSQLLRGGNLKSRLKPSSVKLSQLVQIKKRTWTHTHTCTYTHMQTHICTQRQQCDLLSLLFGVFTKNNDERGNHACPT